jgi:protein-S-isoprenylcysteine O-methyltransferase Ste14
LALVEELESSGQWLFRRRSYLPQVFSGIIFSGLAFFRYPAGSHLLDELWEVICLLVALSGVAVRALTVGFAASHTSGRNTEEQVADSLNTTGMYSIVRNPLYLGNFVIILGVVLFLRIWWIPVLYATLFALYYERIIFAEEMFLRKKFTQDYLAWSSQTPAFFPKFALWKYPAAPFSYKKVLRREYHGVMGLVMFLFLLEVASDLAVGESFAVDLLWRYVLGFTLVGYAVVRVLHKYTSCLK